MYSEEVVEYNEKYVFTSYIEHEQDSCKKQENMH